LSKGKVLAAGSAPQSTVISLGGVIVGNAAGLTWMVLETEASGLPHSSFAVHVSVTSPPQAFGMVDKVEGLEVPLISQLPVKPLSKGKVLATGSPPQATVISLGGVIVGNADGRTVMVLEVVTKLPQLSKTDQVSVTGPPQAFGIELKTDNTSPLMLLPSPKPLV
jgi:hypothetical protein